MWNSYEIVVKAVVTDSITSMGGYGGDMNTDMGLI